MDENSNTEMAHVLAALDRIRYGTRCALLIDHHEPKATADTRARDDTAQLRGAGRLGDDADMVLRLVKDRGLRKLTFAKVKDAAQPDPIWLRQDPETGLLLQTEGPEQKGEANLEKVRLALLARAESGGSTREELETDTKLAKQTVHKYLVSLEAEQVGKGKTTRWLPNASMRPSSSTIDTMDEASSSSDNGLRLIER